MDRFIRVEYPRHLATVNDYNDYDEWGGQREWNWSNPLLLHALSAATGPSLVPAVPDSRLHQAAHETVRGYWNMLVYLLVWRLGWRNVGKGLRWWYENGRPTNQSNELKLLDELWRVDGLLDRFVAFAQSGLTNVAFHEHVVPDALPVPWREFLQTHADDHTSLGPWGLHLELGGHAMGPVEPANNGSAPELHVEPMDKTAATLCVGSMLGWYTALTELGGAHIARVGKKCVITVITFDGLVIGDFRFSDTTGQWYSGPFKYHAVGN